MVTHDDDGIDYFRSMYSECVFKHTHTHTQQTQCSYMIHFVLFSTIKKNKNKK